MGDVPAGELAFGFRRRSGQQVFARGHGEASTEGFSRVRAGTSLRASWRGQDGQEGSRRVHAQGYGQGGPFGTGLRTRSKRRARTGDTDLRGFKAGGLEARNNA